MICKEMTFMLLPFAKAYSVGSIGLISSEDSTVRYEVKKVSPSFLIVAKLPHGRSRKILRKAFLPELDGVSPSQEDLDDLVSGQVLWADVFRGYAFSLINFSYSPERPLKPSLASLKKLLQRYLNHEIDDDDVLLVARYLEKDWSHFATEPLLPDVGILKEPYTEEDAFHQSFYAFICSFTYQAFYIEEEGAKELLNLLSLYEDKVGKDIVARPYSLDERKKLVKALYGEGNHEALAKDSKKSALYLRLLDEGAQENDIESLTQLAFNSYTGTALVPQDFKKSEGYLLRLLSLGELWVGNPLGYIAYLGRTGEPDYTKAFTYWSYGQSYGIKESIYMLSDLYRQGLGCPKSPKLAFQLLDGIYWEARSAFCQGDYDSKLADIDLRLARCYEKGIGVEANDDQANRFYEEGLFAIQKRLLSEDYIGDNVVLKELGEAYGAFLKENPDYEKKGRCPLGEEEGWIYFNQPLHENGTGHVEYRVRGETLYLTISSPKKADTTRFLITPYKRSSACFEKKISIVFTEVELDKDTPKQGSFDYDHYYFWYDEMGFSLQGKCPLDFEFMEAFYQKSQHPEHPVALAYVAIPNQENEIVLNPNHLSFEPGSKVYVTNPRVKNEKVDAVVLKMFSGSEEDLIHPKKMYRKIVSSSDSSF
jgi:TPR repeat protein